MNMKLKDIRDISCTNMKVYVRGKTIYFPLQKNLKSYSDKEVVWIDAEDDILVVGIRDTSALACDMLSKMIDMHTKGGE